VLIVGGAAYCAGGMFVLPANPSDVGDYAAHLARHLMESGRGGSYHFGVSREVSRAQIEEHMETRWSLGTDTVGWARAWLLWDRDPRGQRLVGKRAVIGPLARVVGHVELRGPFIATSMHRSLFSIGIERTHVGKRHGTELINAAVDFAVGCSGLEWIDLQVFASNAPARSLYRRTGFEEVGVCVDAYRMDDGSRIDDVHMVLELRKKR
jgi:ribosomal protein S18 acetylase RimI-like enzyme